MKKLLLGILLLSNFYLKAEVKKTWMLATFDTDAQAYIDSVGDIPMYFQTAINNLVLSMKADSTWYHIKTALIFPPSQDIYKPLTDLKTSLRSAYYYPLVVNPAFTNQILCGNEGIMFNPKGASYLNTGLSANSLTLNSTAIAYISTNNEAVGVAGYCYGALATGQSFIFQKRDLSNQCYADMYGSTVGTGRAKQTSANGYAGVYISNRQSSTNFKLIKNGTAIATNTGTQGSLPTYNIFLNAYSTGATSSSGKRNKSASALFVFDIGLTDAQVTSLNTTLQTFRTESHRTGNYDKTAIFDGNSHMVSNWSGLYRDVMYASAGNSDSINWFNIGVSGQTTSTMITNAGTNLHPLYNTTHKNVLSAWEITNDISIGTSATNAYNHYVTYCNNEKAYASANGITLKIIAMMPMCRGYAGVTSKIIATDSVVTMIRANWHAFADTLCEFPSANYFIPRSSYSSDAAYVTAVTTLTNNTTYYADKTHLTILGEQEWANTLKPIIVSQ